MPSRRKIASWTVGALLALAGFVLLARDLGDAARVRTLDASGTHLPTKVWFLEDGSDVIVRGAPGADWIARLRARPRGDLLFPGRREDFRAEFVTEAREARALQARFREKYGWLDRLDGVRRTLGSGAPRVLVRLRPAHPSRVR